MISFSAESYKTLLRATLEARREEFPSRRYSFQAMAEACRIQKTYLSKVLNREGHLSEDQLYLALDYLGLDDEERDFALLLMAWEKAHVVKRKNELHRRLAEIRRRKMRTEESIQVQATTTKPEVLTAYYLDPMFQVIHMAMTVKRWARQPLGLGEVLGLKETVIRSYLHGLAEMGILRYREVRGIPAEVEVLRDNLHLPQESTLHPAYATQMRLQAIQKLTRSRGEKETRFSVVFSSDPKARENIQRGFLTWLKSVQKQVQEGTETDVYQLNFDLFSWTEDGP